MVTEPHWHVMVITTTVEELKDSGGIDIEEGWEPFSAETQGSSPVIYLRRQSL
jgi:hypothetical protein